MSVVESQPISAQWKERLDLRMRGAPEFYEDPDAVGRSAHAGAIRTALTELGASGVFCVQDLPTVVIVGLEQYDRARVIDVHGALWNQGLATLLLVLSGDTLRAFSLARVPSSDHSSFHDRCLVGVLNAAAEGLEAKSLIYGAESGRLWEQHGELFRSNERIDQVLLGNLTYAYEKLQKDNLSPDAAQALLIQSMFIAYLEDRKALRRKYFKAASDGSSESFAGILESADSTPLYGLFERLREDFHGDLFAAPCSFDSEAPQPNVGRPHLRTLQRFLSGHEEMQAGGQLRFWGYDFKYIPIELISAVYDRFLAEEEAERRKRGAYYTPMFLADTVTATLWDSLPAPTRATGRFLDPACGSGVFLVRLFQLLCEQWRATHKLRTIPWSSLLSILSRLHGWDLSEGAVRVAVFSLYLALLQEVRPPDIRALIDRGRFLPQLWNSNLRAQDFFSTEPAELRPDVIVGNPPWSSRHGPERTSARWASERELPMPGGEDAWAFVWKALLHVRQGGVVGFLLPAMGFLHNHAPKAVEARRRLFRDARVLRVVNFADMRFQLFERAVRPAALLIFGCGEAGRTGYRLDYWTPKADLNLRTRRSVSLTSADKQKVTSHDVMSDPFVFKRRLWMSTREAKLFGYLEALPKLSEFVSPYRSVYRKGESLEGRWVVGNGFQRAQEARLEDDDYPHQHSEVVSTTPYLPVSAFVAPAQRTEGLVPFRNSQVRRRGFEPGFSGPRILIPRGVSTRKGRLRASYLEEPLTFQDIILAVAVPAEEVRRGKLLTALLNSRLLYWYAFHGTASFGSDRPEVKQADLLRLPFPDPNELQQTGRSETAGRELVSLIDEAKSGSGTAGYTLQSERTGLLSDLDRLCYKYFGLGDEEVALVEDAVENVIPWVQPGRGSMSDLWSPATRSDREAYARTLVEAIAQWLDDESDISVVLEARNEDLAMLRMRLVEPGQHDAYRERGDYGLGEALGRLEGQVDVRLPGNFQLVPDFRLFLGRSLYLVKPLQRRFWLKSAALADADAVAMDLHDAVRLGPPA